MTGTVSPTEAKASYPTPPVSNLKGLIKQTYRTAQPGNREHSFHSRKEKPFMTAFSVIPTLQPRKAALTPSSKGPSPDTTVQVSPT